MLISILYSRKRELMIEFEYVFRNCFKQEKCKLIYCSTCDIGEYI